MKKSLLAVIYTGLIVAVTLPLGDISLRNKPEGLAFLLLQSSNFGALDIALNLLLFVPFGFGLARLLNYAFNPRFGARLVTVVFAAIVFSYAIEILQAFTTTRLSSLYDVASNTAGAFLGAICARSYEAKNLRMVFFLYMTAVLILSGILQHNTTLKNWDLSYPLVLGNEATADRPWHGRILELRLFDRAASQQSFITDIEGDDLLTSVVWHAISRSGSGPRLIQTNKLHSFFIRDGAIRTDNQWLQSAAPPTKLAEKLKKSSQFTLIGTVVTEDVNQKGPARIISLSKDANNRNFTLAQDRRDLVFRLRTPVTGENGTNPELRLPGVFSSSEPRHIIVTYDGSALTVAVNGASRSASYQLSPGYVALTYLPSRLRLNLSMEFHRVLYYILAFVPMGILIHLYSSRNGAGRDLRSTGGWILFVSTGLEAVLIMTSGKPFDYLNVVVALLFAASGAFCADFIVAKLRLLSTTAVQLDQVA